MRLGFRLCAQEAISRGHAHREEVVAMLLAQMQMPMPFEGFKKGRQERHQPFGTDVVGRSPDGEQCVQDCFSVQARCGCGLASSG